MMYINLRDISYILLIKNPDYCHIVNGISKSEPINLLPNTGSTEKSETLETNVKPMWKLRGCFKNSKKYKLRKI